MKRITFLMTLLMGMVLSISASTNDSRTISVDTDKSTISWKGKKVTGAHNGLINLQEGTLNFEDGNLKAGQFVIDMTTITCEDLSNESYNKKLVGHLNSADFFATNTYSSSKLVITDVQFVSEAKDDVSTIKTYTVTGDLTIKDITKPVTYISNVVFFDNGRIEARGKLNVNRTAYNIKYKAGPSFGDKMIHNNFELNVFLVGQE